MTNELPSFLKGGDSQGGQSGENHLSGSHNLGLDGERLAGFRVFGILPRVPLTFLKTMGSSSHTGLTALLFWDVLVFSAFLLVSAGSPNMSTSTYTPTRRSVTNWPEMTCGTRRRGHGMDVPRVGGKGRGGDKLTRTAVPSQRGCWPRCRPPCFL